MRVLVTGGAGYIGSYVCRALHRRGDEVVALDNLLTGEPSQLPREVELVQADVRDSRAVARHMGGCTAVIHLAGVRFAGLSSRFHDVFMDINARGTAAVLHAMEERGLNFIVLSSSCAVYGNPASGIAHEWSTLSPLSPYGLSKVAAEGHVRKWATQTRPGRGSKSAAILRYFNVAGASSDGASDSFLEALLPNLMAKTAAGKPFPVFGSDYETQDGTAERDYVHVLDIADAHVKALDFLTGETGQVNPSAEAGRVKVFNLGTEHTTSVLSFIETFSEVSGKAVRIELRDRRRGDPSRVTASAALARRSLGWTAAQTLYDMIDSAYARWLSLGSPDPKSALSILDRDAR